MRFDWFWPTIIIAIGLFGLIGIIDSQKREEHRGEINMACLPDATCKGKMICSKIWNGNYLCKLP